jgi:hypothetical protein
MLENDNPFYIIKQPINFLELVKHVNQFNLNIEIFKFFFFGPSYTLKREHFDAKILLKNQRIQEIKK